VGEVDTVSNIVESTLALSIETIFPAILGQKWVAKLKNTV